MQRNFDKHQNYYKLYKRKNTPIVFIHGVGLDQKMWSPQIKSFTKNTILTYDLLGHGKTPLTKNSLNFDDFTIQLNNLLLNLKIKKIHIVGFSFGSLVALNFTKKYPNKINKLVLVSTVYKRSKIEKLKVLERYQKAKNNISILDQALKRWLSPKFLRKNVKIKKNIIKTLTKNPIEHDNFLKSYKLFAKVKHNTKEIKSIKKKSLVITGSKDTGSTVLMSEKLNKDLVNSQFKKIDGAKHLCTIEYSLNVNMMIKEFLRI